MTNIIAVVNCTLLQLVLIIQMLSILKRTHYFLFNSHYILLIHIDYSLAYFSCSKSFWMILQLIQTFKRESDLCRLWLCSDCRQIGYCTINCKLSNQICMSKHNQLICMSCFGYDVGAPKFLMRLSKRMQEKMEVHCLSLQISSSPYLTSAKDSPDLITCNLIL